VCQHPLITYKYFRGLHQPAVTAAAVLDSTATVETGAAVGASELGAGVTAADVVGLSCIIIIILGSSGRPW
jgi:hypothetical protein